MRRPRKAGGLVIILCSALAAGCFSRGDANHSTAWYDRMRGKIALDHGIRLKTALLDRPVGDRYVNRELWETAKRPLTHEQTTLFARNGMRVGVLSGIIPGEFDRLMSRENDVADMMMHTMTPGKPKVIPINGPLENCSYQLRNELTAEPVSVERWAAECGLSISAKPSGDGGVKLSCELRVQYGEKQAFLKPNADSTAFARQDHKPVDAFPTMNWELTLGPGEYLLLGPTEDPGDTLGKTFFFNRNRQRMLVIRAELGNDPEQGKPNPKPERETSITYGVSISR